MLNKKLLQNEDVKGICMSFALYMGHSVEDDDWQLFVESRIGEAKQKEKEKENKLVAFALKMQECLPDGRCQPSDKPIRSSTANVVAKLKTFFNKYKKTYSAETILEATRQWGICCENKNFEYCKTLNYFIEKDRNSELADYCEDILAGKKIESMKPKREYKNFDI